jgi:hypothetical protein
LKGEGGGGGGGAEKKNGIGIEGNENEIMFYLIISANKAISI